MTFTQERKWGSQGKRTLWGPKQVHSLEEDEEFRTDMSGSLSLLFAAQDSHSFLSKDELEAD